MDEQQEGKGTEWHRGGRGGERSEEVGETRQEGKKQDRHHKYDEYKDNEQERYIEES